MYEFYYNTLKPFWKEKMQLHYMDTDSFILSFDSTFDELTNFLQENKNEFDFSELDKNNKLYDSINKKVVGKMKIETSPIITLDNFTSLRAKSYCYSYANIEKGRQKGIRKLQIMKIIKEHYFYLKLLTQQIIQLNLIIIN